MPIPLHCGGAPLMHPLILHGSSKGTIKSLRGMLHYVFGPPQLPEGLNLERHRNTKGTSYPRAPSPWYW